MNIKYDINGKRTKRMGFVPLKGADGQYLFGGAVPCTVNSIELVDVEYKEGEFAGLEVKAIKYEFEQIKLEVDDPDRFITSYVKMPGSMRYKDKNNHMAGMKPINDEDLSKIVKGILDWIFHVQDSFSKASNYKPTSKFPKRTLTAFTNIKAISTIPAEDRVKFWNSLFSDIVEFINNDGKPIYTNDDGSSCELWCKITPNYSPEPKFNRTYYTISSYVEKGLFEPLRRKEDGSLIMPKTLVIDISRLPLKSGLSKPQDDPAGINQGPGAINIQEIMSR